MKRLLRNILPWLLVAAAAACHKRTVISDRELALIFRDAFLTNAYVDTNNVPTDSVKLYEPIFARYGYTAEDVQHTVGNFSKRKSARLSDVVEAAIALLEEEGKRYDREVAILDTVRQAARRKTARTLRLDTLVRIGSLRDTARLSFRFDAEPGEYVVSYGYLVDSLDRNGPLQSRMWIERKDGSRSGAQYVALRRNRSEQVRRTFTVDTAARALRLHLLAFPDRAQQPSVTFRDVRVTRILPEEEAIRALYEQQLDIRIFADEFFRALDPADRR